MTPGARRVLKDLAADAECDLVQEGFVVYCGTRRTTSLVVNELLGLTAISILYRDGFLTKFTNYGINTTGCALVRRPELEKELLRAIHARLPFQIIDDRIVMLDRNPIQRIER